MNRRLNKIVLKNIKAHLDTTIELTDGFNVIGGESAEGKSIIMSAVMWVLENTSGWNPKPWANLGVAPSAKSRVELHFNDGLVVTRARSTKENYYQVSGGEKLKSLRAGVPTEVLDVLNMGEQNIQLQKDTYFLFQMSAGKVAKKLNEVVDLGEVDDAIQTSLSRVKRTRGKLKVSGEYGESLGDQISKLDWVVACDKTLADIHSRFEQYTEGKSKVDDILDRISELELVQNKLAGLGVVEAMLESINFISGHHRVTQGRCTHNEANVLSSVVEAKQAQDKLRLYPDINLMSTQLMGGEGTVAGLKQLATTVRECAGAVLDAKFILGGVKQFDGFHPEHSKLYTYNIAELITSNVGDVEDAVAGAQYYSEELTDCVSDVCVSDILGVIADCQSVSDAVTSRLVGDVKSTITVAVKSEADTDRLGIELHAADEELHQYQESIGECPLCGRV